MKSEIKITPLAVSALVWAAISPAACVKSPADAAVQESAWVGRWTGIAHDEREDFRRSYLIDFTIADTPTGLVLINNDRESPPADPLPITIKGNSLTTEHPSFFGGAITVSATLSDDLSTLRYQSSGGGMTGLHSESAELSRNNPDTRKFLAPRINSEGEKILSYRYHAPERREDGLDVSTAAAEGIDPAGLEQLVEHILKEGDEVDTPHIESVLILRNGKLVFEEYFWGQSADNPHMISSCTKSVTSMLMGIAWDRGRIALDEPVSSLFADYPQTLWVKENYPVTIRNMLSMNSGTEWNDTSASGQPSVMLLKSEDVAGYMLDKPLIHTPGQKYNYDNGLPTLAGVVLARAMKESFETFAERELLEPLGISNYQWSYLREGTPLAAGGMYLTSRAMAKLGQVILDDGVWKGRRILSADWVAESTRNQSSEGDYPYGFYWHLNNADQRHFEKFDGYNAIGQGGQHIAVLPAQNMVIVFTSSSWRNSAVGNGPDQPFGLISRFVVPSVKPLTADAE